MHYLVNRRWREAFTASATAVAVTVGPWLAAARGVVRVLGRRAAGPGPARPQRRHVQPEHPRRSSCGVGPDGLPATPSGSLLVAVVGFVGFSLARRAYRAGDSISEVAAVGLMAVLLSPVAWIHHLHWMVVVVFAVLGADPLRDRRRLAAAAVITGFFLCRMPWWGITWLSHPRLAALAGPDPAELRHLRLPARARPAVVGAAPAGARDRPGRGGRRQPARKGRPARHGLAPRRVAGGRA